MPRIKYTIGEIGGGVRQAYSLIIFVFRIVALRRSKDKTTNS